MNICIDPGHGGKDNGAKGFGIFEKDVNLDISLKLEEILKSRGFDVYMTRREDSTLSPSSRVEIVNNYDCDLTLSIHNNAASTEDGHGSEVIYPYRSERGKRTAQHILDSLGELGLKKRRIYYRLNSDEEDYYFMIRNIKNLSLIVECSFITNLDNNKLLQDDGFRLKIAEAIAKGIDNHKRDIEKYEQHWAKGSFERIRGEGLVLEDHDLDSHVTWGEFSTVINRLLDKMDLD